MNAAVNVDIIDQFERYGRYGYAIRVTVDSYKNSDPEKQFAVALNLNSLR